VWSLLVDSGGNCTISSLRCAFAMPPLNHSAIDFLEVHMVKVLVVLMLVAVPLTAFAQEANTFNSPTADIFITRAEVCAGNSPGCGTASGTPQNVIQSGSGGVRGFVAFRSPATQTYTVYYLAVDPEGALDASSIVTQPTAVVNAGDTAAVTANFGALGSGLYRFTPIVIGANGRAAIGQPYQFRYCNAACITD
jgi:hypothetical protein